MTTIKSATNMTTIMHASLPFYVSMLLVGDPNIEPSGYIGETDIGRVGETVEVTCPSILIVDRIVTVVSIGDVGLGIEKAIEDIVP
jgi:hypothetical protein